MAATNKSRRQRMTRDYDNGLVSTEDYVNALWEEKYRSTEQWREDHLMMHTLEKRALDEAKKVTDGELAHLNQVRTDVIKDRGDFFTKDSFATYAVNVADKFSSVDKKIAWLSGAFAVINFLGWAVVIMHDHILALMK